MEETKPYICNYCRYCCPLFLNGFGCYLGRYGLPEIKGFDFFCLCVFCHRFDGCKIGLQNKNTKRK